MNYRQTPTALRRRAYVFRMRARVHVRAPGPRRVCTYAAVLSHAPRVYRVYLRAWRIYPFLRVTRNAYGIRRRDDPGVIIQSKHERRRGSVIHRITPARVYTAYGFKHAVRGKERTRSSALIGGILIGRWIGFIDIARLTGI